MGKKAAKASSPKSDTNGKRKGFASLAVPASWSKELNEPNKELSIVDEDMISFGLAKEGGMAKAVDGRRLSGRWLAKEGGLLEAAKKMYSYYIEEFTVAKHWKDRPNKRVFYAITGRCRPWPKSAGPT